MPEVAPHERESAAFWFRRIATTIIIGNGAGVIGLGSFLGNTDDMSFAASVSYPALSLYLTGVFLGFGSFVISLLWSSLRMEAYGEYVNKLTQIADKIKSNYTIGQWTFIFSAVVLSMLQLGVIIGSGISFYMGSAHVVGSLGHLACDKIPNRTFCMESPSPFFGKPESNIIAPMDWNSSANKFTANGTFKKRARSDGTFFYTVDRMIVTAPQELVKGTTSSYMFRLSRLDQYNRNLSCTIEIHDWFSDPSSPYVINPRLARFLSKAIDLSGTIRVEPMSVELNIRHVPESEGIGNKLKFDFSTLRFDTTNENLRPLPIQAYRNAELMGIPGPRYLGGLLVYPSVSSRPNNLCISLAREAGFEIIL